MKANVRQSDIAKKLNVSRVTVSKALRDHPDIRTEGYIEALTKNKIPIRKEWIIEGGFEQRDGYGSFKKLNSLGNLPEVIFAVNDRVALGAYKAAKEAGLRIPEDLGIFGFGFNEITDFFDHQLTLINQNPREMGMEAIKLLINEIEKKQRTAKAGYLLKKNFYGKNRLNVK